ncbi:hypothetical protein HaLaN_26776 [Haematococcus lacustris]|uniref:Uncharacterized protein n=1 Tax=Haematococcus lacustris TaxID=44745 RepID=A0A6A0A745_HAELA|nr:hypothetical protein HaLaN_26776 [Haematococcus lacustris]
MVCIDGPDKLQALECALRELEHDFERHGLELTVAAELAWWLHCPHATSTTLTPLLVYAPGSWGLHTTLQQARSTAPAPQPPQLGHVRENVILVFMESPQHREAAAHHLLP